jgi:hypothetical protein
MSDPGRTIADLVAQDAPVPPRRAGAVVLAVARVVQREEASGTSVGALDASDVAVQADGSVDLAARATTRSTSPLWSTDTIVPTSGDPGPAGAAIGRLLFELLIGRPPLGREDAFEPAITVALAPEACALLARSCSEAEGQWPSVDEWVRTLEALAGGQAAPLPPSVVAQHRLRRALVTVGVVVLAACSVGAVLMAPTWWDGANGTPVHQGD